MTAQTNTAASKRLGALIAGKSRSWSDQRKLIWIDVITDLLLNAKDTVNTGISYAITEQKQDELATTQQIAFQKNIIDSQNAIISEQNAQIAQRESDLSNTVNNNANSDAFLEAKLRSHAGSVTANSNTYRFINLAGFLNDQFTTSYTVNSGVTPQVPSGTTDKNPGALDAFTGNCTLDAAGTQITAINSYGALSDILLAADATAVTPSIFLFSNDITTLIKAAQLILLWHTKITAAPLISTAQQKIQAAQTEVSKLTSQLQDAKGINQYQSKVKELEQGVIITNILGLIIKLGKDFSLDTFKYAIIDQAPNPAELDFLTNLAIRQDDIDYNTVIQEKLEVLIKLNKKGMLNKFRSALTGSQGVTFEQFITELDHAQEQEMDKVPADDNGAHDQPLVNNGGDK